MKRIRILLAIFSVSAALALAAAPAMLSSGGVSGGGVLASGAGRTLSGAVGGLGLPATAGGVSQGGGLRLEVGPVPAMNFPPRKPAPSAADPIWLRLEAAASAKTR